MSICVFVLYCETIDMTRHMEHEQVESSVNFDKSLRRCLDNKIKSMTLLIISYVNIPSIDCDVRRLEFINLLFQAWNYC